MNQKIKTLFLAANPKQTTPLALDEEIREISIKVRLSEGRDLLDVVSAWAVRPDDLIQYLNRFRPQIVHFSGHGSSSGELILVNNTGQMKPVSIPALKALFSTLKDNIEIVVLNACYSQTQGRAINEIIDFVIGMNATIGDQAAIVFAASFYRALGFNRTVQEAFDQAKTALLLEGIPEHATPVLLVKEGVSSNRRLKPISGSNSKTESKSSVPVPVQEYLKKFPQFDVSHEIKSQYVRTSRESFFSALAAIFDSLNSSQEVISTDSIQIERSFITYWLTEGLGLLELNFSAAKRGINQKRIFLVSGTEEVEQHEFLSDLFALQAAAGILPILVNSDLLPSNYLREFLVFGDQLVDEVIYDVYGINVIDNYIHWSTHKVSQFREKAKFILSHAEPFGNKIVSSAETFEDVKSLALQLRMKYANYP